jgi:CheY-like chemotaxis protein
MQEKKRIVVLDDNEPFAALLVAALETDYTVVFGLNGHEGLRLCHAAHTDLLITDIGMPELDGIQMLKELQKDTRLSAIPVIVVTATHFHTQARSNVSRYPQVRTIISKTSGIDFITAEVRKVLHGPGIL